MELSELGRIVATRAVNDLKDENEAFSTFMSTCLNRYLQHDWGDLSKADAQTNDRAVESGDDRILASYLFPPNAPWNAANSYGGSEDGLWIITERDRSVTTFLFPGEY